MGNNRIVANASGTSIQSTQYYPFGMAFAEGTTTEQGEQDYKYNGKELDRTHGLNWYDYSARFLDNAIGRTPTMDPHSENYYSWSPYAYTFNNPMRFIDPTGKDGWDILWGVADAVSNNLSWGATDYSGLDNQSQITSAQDYNLGRSIGDGVSVVMGALEVVVGGVAAGGGAAMSPTGVGVGVAVVGGAAVAHGYGAISKALQGNGKMEMSSKSNNSSSNKKEVGSYTNTHPL